MGIILLDNNNTVSNSYLKGWELALKTFEEESSSKSHRQRGNHKKKNSQA